MALNFQKGKTEVMIKYRGKGARDAKENLRKLPASSGSQSLPVELVHGSSVRNVGLVLTDVYKHLGSLVSIDGLLAPEAHARVRSAMSSYAPLSAAILGSRSVSVARRMRLGWSLVISRLCYNIHVWSHVPQIAWRSVNTMYNRLWSRIYGQPRFCQTERSDFEVRLALGVPSLDCFLRRRRLKYLSRLAGVDLPALHALLQADDGRGNRMPWAMLLLEDLSMLRSALPRVFGSLPHPAVDASPYWEIASKFPQEWCQIVNEYFTSQDDPGRLKRPACVDSHPSALRCSKCRRGPFSSAKALAQHELVAHGKRTPVSAFVGAWKRCPVCHTEFASRLHLVNHLADKRVRSKVRQTNCGIVFLSADPRMVESSLFSTLMASDKLERQQARKLGHTRPIVGAAAKKGGPSCLKGVSTACAKRRCAPHRRLGGKTDPRHSPACRQGSLANRNCEQHAARQAARKPPHIYIYIYVSADLSKRRACQSSQPILSLSLSLSLSLNCPIDQLSP